MNDEIILNSEKNKKNSDKNIRFNKIKKEYNTNILKLKNDIDNNNKKKKELINKNKKFIEEISSLKNEYKVYLSKNLKLSEIIKELEYKIDLLEINIEEKNLLIKVLKDVSHHG